MGVPKTGIILINGFLWSNVDHEYLTGIAIIPLEGRGQIIRQEFVELLAFFTLINFSDSVHLDRCQLLQIAGSL